VVIAAGEAEEDATDEPEGLEADDALGAGEAPDRHAPTRAIEATATMSARRPMVFRTEPRIAFTRTSTINRDRPRGVARR
jgi:hypothetical protein